MDLTITPEERIRIRELAKRQQEYSALPIMKEREMNWFRHNELKGDVPMLSFETITFEEEILPALQCVSPAARKIELQILRENLNHEQIGDDKVVAPYFRIHWLTDIRLFDIRIRKTFAEDAKGRSIGYHNEYPVKELEKDLALLKPTCRHVDREGTHHWKMFVEDALGDILPVRMSAVPMGFSITEQALELMGMESLMVSMMDEPELVHELLERISEDLMETIRWHEREGLLLANNGNDLLWQGSAGFSHDLPVTGGKGTPITSRDLWGYMDVEIIGLSPRMFGEFLFPHYLKASQMFGLISYGCCEMMHPFWEEHISKISNLRKISIASWTDERFMGEALKGKGVIYHRKPSANFMGITHDFDEEGFRKDILNTLSCARGNKLEFSFRDVYTLSGDNGKPRKAVKILRQLIENNWK